MAGASEVARMRLAYAWPGGGPGVSTVHFTQGLGSGTWDWIAAAGYFYNEFADVIDGESVQLVDNLTWELERSVDIINVASGNITNQITVEEDLRTGSGSDSGTQTSRAQQLFWGFKSDVWQDGRRLRGGMFFGPIGSNSLEDDGSVRAAVVAGVADDFVALTSGVGPRLAVYHRPPGTSSSGGYYGDVVEVKCKSTPGTLRSRRD